MNSYCYPSEDSALAKSCSSKKNYGFSFSSFQKAIKANSELRKQIDDIVDLGLYDYVLRQNTAYIQSVRVKAEAETIELMMRFANGTSDYLILKNKIHRNRIIRTLAIMDLSEQVKLMNKLRRLMVGAK
jgi:hypothetical protein